MRRDPRYRYWRPFRGTIGRGEALNPDRVAIPNHAQSTAELRQRMFERREQRYQAKRNRVRVSLKR